MRVVRALMVSMLLACCCRSAAGQGSPFETAEPDQVLGSTAPAGPSDAKSSLPDPQDVLRLRVQQLSDEVARLREQVDANSGGGELPGKVVPASAESISGRYAPANPNKSWLQGKFDQGWQLTSGDGNFTLKPDVEVNLDTVWLRAEDDLQYNGPGAVGPVTDGINVRRGRIGAKGTMYGNFEYMIQYDMNLAATTRNGSGAAPNVINSPQPTEIFGAFHNLPFVRTIRIGNQKPLWSFENFTSSRFQNFMERSFGWDAFNEDQNNGFIPTIVMLNHNEEGSFVYQAGVGKNNRTAFFYNNQQGNYLVEGRLAWSPWFKDNGRYLLHIGVGSMYADTDNGIARFRARTLLRNASNQTHPILTEARMFAHREARVVPEFALQIGPLMIQSEYYMAWATQARTIAGGQDGPDLGTWFGDAFYVQVNYLLTGEYIPYERKMARWGRLVPNHNFSSDGGWGAWMIGVRYSNVDLNDLGGVNGSGANNAGYTPSSARVDDVSLCLNWIVNPNARMLFDGILERRNAANTPGSDGTLVGFGMRLQFDY
jgi:phosphate-selective porin OprO and OprP